MTPLLPAGCTAPDISGLAYAQLQGKILTSPAIRWSPSLTDRVTYTMNGHAEHATVPNSGFAVDKEVGQLRKEGAEDIAVTGRGGAYDMPVALRTAAEDVAGHALDINPAAIPAGIGLSIDVDVASPPNLNFGVVLVAASPQCTGS